MFPNRHRSAAHRMTSRSRGCGPSLTRLGKQLVEIARGSFRERLNVFATQLGEETGGVGDEGRLTSLAAMRHGRKERRVGFDQQPVRREPCRGRLEILGV